MKRMLCMLLVLLLVPCLALGEAFTLLTSCPLQVTSLYRILMACISW